MYLELQGHFTIGLAAPPPAAPTVLLRHFEDMGSE